MKTTIAIVALVVLVAVASVLGTLAYLTDTKKVDNTFTMGDVKIKLDETDVNNPEGDRVTKNEYAVYPGEIVTKDFLALRGGQTEDPQLVRDEGLADRELLCRFVLGQVVDVDQSCD